MSKKQLLKILVSKIALCIFILLSIFEGFIIIKLVNKKNYLEESRKGCWRNYDNAIKKHTVVIEVKNLDRDLHGEQH